MKYSVNVKETTFGFIEVDADSAEEAYAKAEEEYNQSGAYWHDSQAEFYGAEAEEQ